MKTSRFNIFFPFEDKIIGYNSLFNDYIILEQDLYELFLAAEREGIEQLKEIHEEFYELLIEKKFIISNDVNEILEVKKLVDFYDSGSDQQYHVIINPTMNCNFKCWYCYETHIKDSKMTSSIIDRVNRHLFNKLHQTNIKMFTLSWFGGEPLLYFEKCVLPILKNTFEICKENNILFSSDFTTNGYLISEVLLEQCIKYGVSHFQITLDGHRKRHNEVRYVTKERGSYDEIVENIKLSIKYGINVTVRINVSKETIESEIENIMDDFNAVPTEHKKLLTFSFNKVWQEEIDLHTEIKNIINSFQEKDYHTAYNMNIDNVRESCYADKRNQATINYNGDVFKCTARDFSSDNREGILLDDGTIEWNEKFEQRMIAKFKNTPCLECKILPICNGGCSQTAMEKIGQEYCIHDFDESKKIDIIRDKFLYAIS